MLPTVSCSVVATRGQTITKAVRSSLQVKVTTECGVDIICREEMVGESCLLFTFPVAQNGRCEVEAMLASLHLPGSPLIIPPSSRVETVASELGLLLKDNDVEIGDKEFEKISSPELTKVTSYQETRVKTEGDTDRDVDKLSCFKEVVKGKGQGQEEEVISTREPMLKVEEGMDPKVNKSSHLKQVRKEVVKEKCQFGQGQGSQAVAQLRRPAGTKADGTTSQVELEVALVLERKSNDATGNLNTKPDCASLAEQPMPIDKVVQVDPMSIEAVGRAPVVGDHLETRIEKADKKLEVGVSCYFLDEDTKMWHAGRVHDVLNLGSLVVVQNLDKNLVKNFTGCPRDQVVLSIEEIPHGAMCADSAKKTVSKKEEGRKVQPGEECVARWSEDLVWYRAEILATTPTLITVRFIDYGNEADVKDCDIVSAGWEVPAEDLLAGKVDFNVVLEEEEESETRLDNETAWSRGETCLARWEVDGVWYRAEVVQATSEGFTRVLFVDYSNQDDATALVRTTAELGEDDVRDHHVDAVEDLPNQQAFKGDSAKPADAVLEKSGETELKELACCVCGKLKKVSYKCHVIKMFGHLQFSPLTSSYRQCIVCSATGLQFAGTVL